MSGIVVGIDGSHNASHALDWAMAEAAMRDADLTVIAVHPVPASYWTGNPVTLPAKALIGASESQVVHHAKCPVVVVPAGR